MSAAAERSRRDPRVLAERVRLLYARAGIAQATVVVNATLVAWIFWPLVPPARSLAWVGALCAVAALRIALVRAYRRSATALTGAAQWGRRFVAGAALTGIGWGAAPLIFYARDSAIHQLFLAFVLGGMAAGAATSNASHLPAFVAYAVPALLPMVVRLAVEGDPIHGAMAFMLVLFGAAVGGLSRSSAAMLEQTLELRFRNEALVENLTAAQGRLERLNADLEHRVGERTAELERALGALREADQRKNEFIGVLSHELRNPLAPIRTSLYLLEHGPHDAERAARARETIDRQALHLARIVDDLLDVTRISRGKIELRPSRIDAREVVRRACEDQRKSFEDRRIVLHLEGEDPVWIDADETRIAQVVGNLLHNAAKFTHEGGSVVARVGAAAGRAVISVRDDGVGIEADLLPQLFQPFVQARGGLARTTGGLGLGLALVKGLVELHGGSVSARSDGPGRGTELTISLPLASAPGVRTPAPVGERARRAPAHVLVIEDNPDAARSLAEVLALEGHDVHVATSGTSGIAKARELEPDIILCDIGLPDVDGYEIARTIRSDEALRSTRLVALSGYAQPEDRQRAAEAGFDEHLSKPAPIDAVLAIVAAAVRS